MLACHAEGWPGLIPYPSKVVKRQHLWKLWPSRHHLRAWMKPQLCWELVKVFGLWVASWDIFSCLTQGQGYNPFGYMLEKHLNHWWDSKPKLSADAFTAEYFQWINIEGWFLIHWATVATYSYHSIDVCHNVFSALCFDISLCLLKYLAQSQANKSNFGSEPNLPLHMSRTMSTHHTTNIEDIFANGHENGHN